MGEDKLCWEMSPGTQFSQIFETQRNRCGLRWPHALVFPVVMYGCERWTIKKAERRRIDDFELRCWRRLLRVPWIARRFNQFILKEVSPEYSLEWISFKRTEWCWSWSSSSLATCCKELTDLKRPWCWERLKAGGEGDNRGWDGWMASPTQWSWV